jgi:type VI secretion system secreted protein Hcp
MCSAAPVWEHPVLLVADYFLKIDGISGESTDAKHKGEIELVSFSWGVSQPGSERGSVGGAARAKFQDFQFVMRVNKASPQLFLACVGGKHIKEASLSVRRAVKKQLEYLKIKFSEVFVTSFQQAGGDDVPEEMVAFDFEKIAIDYTPHSPQGQPGAAVSAGWDLSQNAKV